ncbi:fimbrial protein [Pseudomonas sp. 8O]|uniref:fimbrial protein n=1 Tax=Pseudomonas sp. 8O TaxID=2653165 RepID=UPI0012EF635D|nr:fimbrial protein [Pseudomonas sp. 8O]VXC36096.1 Fimbria A protein [Pseudomonas sp. 8O]
MKLNRIALATLMAIGVATAANAADQGSGKVTFVGSIIDAPCSIAPESLDQTVSLGAVSNAALANGGANDGESTPVSFNIELQGCSLGVAGQEKVSVSFNGAESGYAAGVGSLGLIGTASGAYIRLSQVDGQNITLNTATPPRTISVGDNTLTFQASLKGAGEPIVPGSFQVPANFVLSYQ